MTDTEVKQALESVYLETNDSGFVYLVVNGKRVAGMYGNLDEKHRMGNFIINALLSCKENGENLTDADERVKETTKSLHDMPDVIYALKSNMDSPYTGTYCDTDDGGAKYVRAQKFEDIDLKQLEADMLVKCFHQKHGYQSFQELAAKIVSHLNERGILRLDSEKT